MQIRRVYYSKLIVIFVLLLLILIICGSLYSALRSAKPSKKIVEPGPNAYVHPASLLITIPAPTALITSVNPAIIPNKFLNCGIVRYDIEALAKTTNFQGEGVPPFYSPTLDCFSKASASCEPAKITANIVTNVGYDGSGVTQTETQDFEIRQTTTGLCELFGKVLNIDFTITPSIAPHPTVFYPIQDTSLQGLEKLKEAVTGNESYCLYQNYQDLTRWLSYWQGEGANPFNLEHVNRCYGNFGHYNESPVGG